MNEIGNNNMDIERVSEGMIEMCMINDKMNE